MSGIDGYSYYITNDSDEEEVRVDSSDEEQLDEVDVFLHGTPQQKRKVLKCLTGDEASSSDDDFEKVMQGELEAKVKALENSWRKTDSDAGTSAGGSNAATSGATSSKPEFYDDIYFDSDDESKSKKQRLTDDELLYDPLADDEDQKWVDKQRKRFEKKKSSGKKKSDAKPAEGSDAILSCPACMTILCMDCQRHSLYQNQYRAMFVMNCDVKYDELLHYKEKQKRQFRRHRKRGRKSTAADQEKIPENIRDNQTDEESSSYHPVKCSVCSTEVAVYDSDEIYHFFNVLSGYA